MSKKPIPANAPIRLAGTDALGASKKWEVCKIWTAKLGKRFTPVSSYFLENYHRLKYPITATELALIVHLLRYKWDEAMPYPAIATLGEKMGRSEQAVRTAARSLERKGYLKRHMVKGDTNHFDLQPLFSAVEELFDEDEAKKAAEPVETKKARVRRMA